MMANFAVIFVNTFVFSEILVGRTPIHGGLPSLKHVLKPWRHEVPLDLRVASRTSVKAVYVSAEVDRSGATFRAKINVDDGRIRFEICIVQSAFFSGKALVKERNGTLNSLLAGFG